MHGLYRGFGPIILARIRRKCTVFRTSRQRLRSLRTGKEKGAAALFAGKVAAIPPGGRGDALKYTVFQRIGQNMRWKPNTTVAAVIERDGRFLMVEEQTVDGLRLNQPAGHLEEGESLLAAVERETLEETGHLFVPDCLVGIYRWTRPQGDITYLRFTFGGVRAVEQPGHTLDPAIVRALWLSAEELRACRERHRGPMVMQSIEDWLAGRRYGLDLLREPG